MSDDEEFHELRSLIEAKVTETHARMPRFSREVAARWWRLNNLYWIEDEYGKKVKFRATPIQTRMFFRLHSRNVVPKARQVRLSTLMLLLALDTALFKGNQTIGIVDKTDEDAKRKLARMRFAYDHLDDKDDEATAAMGRMIKLMAPRRLNSAHEMQWANDSKAWASTSLRGGTITFLWVTEFGPIAADFPEKAAEIKTGTLNALHAGPGLFGCIESTYKGGRFGKFFEMIRLAQKSGPRPNALQWRLSFFGWHDEPTYQLPVTGPLIISGKQVEYFEQLEREIGRKLTPEQKHWYITKEAEQGEDMHVEFPGTLEEAIRGKVEGAIYGEQMRELRARGRIGSLVVDRTAPLFSFWDIGVSDYTCIWLLQFVGFDVHAVDYYAANGKHPAEHCAYLVKQERALGVPILGHFVPHDAEKRDNANKTYRDLLLEAGLRNVRTVPRTPDVWVGINLLRGLLPRFRFAEACEKDREENEEFFPSGVACLEAYRRKVELVGGVMSESPVHDESSHAADALRTYAEAHKAKLLREVPALEGEMKRRVEVPQVRMGLAQPHASRIAQREPPRQIHVIR